MTHRAFSAMLFDLGASVLDAHAERPPLRVPRVEMSVPVELWIDRDSGDGIAFCADLPVWRWRTAFDQTPSRMRITWEEVEAR
jgi:hypothetical protein